jgi:hypothetical protein
MKSGKFDEELSRMSDIADDMTSNSMVLFNESFAATNEREGSEIGRQIVCALSEKGGSRFSSLRIYMRLRMVLWLSEWKGRCSSERRGKPTGSEHLS